MVQPMEDTAAGIPARLSGPRSGQDDAWEPAAHHASDPSPAHSDLTNGHYHINATPTPPPPPLPTPRDDNKSVSRISIRAFLLGLTLGLCIPLTLLLAYNDTALWRAPFFLAALAVFHFLEFYTTAKYNPHAAGVGAFLFSSNGKSYNIAHTLAFFECFLHHGCFPSHLLWSQTQSESYLVVGLIMLVCGQVTRTVAMAHAGSNFNHLVQSKKKLGHELVTDGIYAYLRHPSYFGFFWWGLGTQLVLGNVICLAGFAVVLWRFFRWRIESASTL